MSTNAIEENFPAGSAVLVVDKDSKYYERAGIVEAPAGQFSVRVRFKTGRFANLDVSKIRVLEEYEEEDVPDFEPLQIKPEEPEEPAVK